MVMHQDEQSRKRVSRMANDKAVAAESVASVLESARAQRQSGRLLVGQYTGGRLQEGEIYLQEGQPVYARLGSLLGQEALSRLSFWRNVQFTFMPDETNNVATQPGPALDTGGRVASLPARPPAERTPARPAAPPRANQARTDALFPGLATLTPQKRDTDRDVLSLPLTRPQRYVYFMVDGRRTIADISRCTGKTVQEIDLILSALQAQGLVVI
jgi:Domain of unknown function (DUF4388)